MDTRAPAPAAAPTWHFYVLRVDGAALYAGIATDVERRVREHRGAGGRGAKALRGRRSLELAWSLEIGRREEALRVEHRFKRLPKVEKETLVRDAPSREALLDRLGLARGSGLA